MSSDSQPQVNQDDELFSANVLPATCQVCCKVCGVQCSLLNKCVTYRAQYHVSCLANNFIANKGGALRTSRQWLADFLRDENFHLVCKACIELRVNPILDFPNKRQQNVVIKLNDDDAVQTSGLVVRMNDLHLKITSIEQHAACEFTKFIELIISIFTKVTCAQTGPSLCSSALKASK